MAGFDEDVNAWLHEGSLPPPQPPPPPGPPPPEAVSRPLMQEDLGGERVPGPYSPHPPEPMSSGQAGAEAALSILGAGVGTVGGGVAGGPPGAVAGGMLGATLGSAVGAGIMKGPEEVGWGAARGAMGQALSYPLGWAMGRVPGLRNIFRAAARAPTRHAFPGAARSQELALAGGAGLSAGQVTDNQAVQFLEGYARHSLVGGPVAERGMIAGQLATQRSLDRYVASIARDPIASGFALRDALAGGRAAYRAMDDVLYQELDDVIRAAGITHEGVIDSQPWKVWINHEAARYPNKKDPGLARLFGLQREINALPRRLTFSEAKGLRTQLGAHTGMPGESVDIVGGAYKKMFGQVAQSMDEVGLDPRWPAEVTTAYKRALAHHAQKAEIFNSDMIQKMALEANPENLYWDVVKPGEPSNLLRLRAALRDAPRGEQVWRELQGRHELEILAAVKKAQSRVPGTGTQLGGREIYEGRLILDELNKMGKASEAALYDGGESPLRAYANAILQSRIRPGQGRGIIWNVTQGGAVLGLATGRTDLADEHEFGKPLTVGSALVLLAPAAVAKGLRDRRFLNYLVGGIRAPVGSRAAAAAFGQAIVRGHELGIIERPIDEVFGAKPGTVQEKRARRLEAARSAGQVFMDRVREKVRVPEAPPP